MTRYAQDRAAHMPLGVFTAAGHLLAVVPRGGDLDAAYAFRDEAAARVRMRPDAVEVLALCPGHPTVSAVDCMICDPLDVEEATR